MVSTLLRRRRTCDACGGPTDATTVCGACREAFSIARLAHPSTAGAALSSTVDAEQTVVDDMDMWDAWSRLGDVGDRPRRFGAG